MKKEGMKD